MKKLLLDLNKQIEKFYDDNIDKIIEGIKNTDLVLLYTPINIMTSILENSLSNLEPLDNEIFEKYMEFVSENVIGNEKITKELTSLDSYYPLGASLVSLGLTLLNIHEFHNKNLMDEKIRKEEQKTTTGLEELDEFLKILKAQIESEINEDIIDKYNNGYCSDTDLLDAVFEGEVTMKEVLSRVNEDKLISLTKKLEKELFPKENIKIMYYK